MKRKVRLDSLYSDLPLKYFFVGLGLILFVVIALTLWGNWERAEPIAEPVASIVAGPAYRAVPDLVPPRAELLQKLTERGGPALRAELDVDLAIARLQDLISNSAISNDTRDVDWISPEFKASGIDVEQFRPRFSDGQIEIHRWIGSNTAPGFAGKEAWKEFVANVTAPWKDSETLRFELKSYGIISSDQTMTVNLVTEAVGKPQTEEAASIQETGLWKTDWQRDGNKLTLLSIEVQAAERVTADLNQGQLLMDCTASILRHCECLPKQLSYGLDQWAHRIPNLDVVGNQGIAIGDIDQDGLDDLYVCQPHGLPNLLLVQNPDGTVDDESSSRGLDVLDESHAALMIDVDNDHDQDLIVATDENLLLFSNTDGRFQLEHQLPIGRNAHSISAADYDRDGDLDIFLCKHQNSNRQNDLLMFPNQVMTAENGGRNVLLQNNEGWNFRDVTKESGFLGNQAYSRAASWFDFDDDGDLDLYVANEFSSDQLFENTDGWFTDVSEKHQIQLPGRHRSVSVGEFNQDGKLDLMVGADVPLAALSAFNEPNSPTASQESLAKMLLGENQIWFGNQANAQTAEAGSSPSPLSPYSLRAPIFSSQSTFGTATVDLNNDGLDDLVVSNGYLTRNGTADGNRLFYHNALNEVSEDPSIESAQKLSMSLAGTALEVAELCQMGNSYSAGQRNRCFLSIGPLGFANFSGLSGVDFPDDSRAVAITDWDNDGDQDVVLTCRSGPQLRILCNQLDSENAFVHFDLTGTKSNADAIGAKIELYVSGQSAPLVKLLQAGSGNLSQSTKRLMFGIGKSEKIQRAVVHWPSGTTQTFDKLAINTRYSLVEGQPQPTEISNLRFNLAVQPRTLDRVSGIPDTGKGSVFYPRPPIPRLEYQAARDKWLDIRSGANAPQLVYFGTRSSTTEEFLELLTKNSRQINARSLDCLTIFLELDRTVNTREQWDLADTMMASLEHPHRWGTASDSMVDKLKYLFGDWFSDRQLPRPPFVLVLDSKANVCGFYSESDIQIDAILLDVDRTEQSDLRYRRSAAPLSGKWFARYRLPHLNGVRASWQQSGYPSDAKLYQLKSQPQRAYELCHNAIEVDADGNSKQAVHLFKQAIEMDDQCVFAYVGLGNLLHRQAIQLPAGQGRAQAKLLDEAATNYEQALAIDPTNSEAAIGHANVSIDQNQSADALQQLTEFLHLDPSRYEVHAIIGRLLFQQKQYDKAAQHLATAFDNRPTLPFVAGDLGYLYLRSGKYSDARKYLRIAHELHPSDDNILRLLAEAEFVTGNYDTAVALFERVAELDPSSRRPKNVLAWLLATCPYEAHRDGDQALAIINPLMELFGDKSPSTLEIYAASFAEVGDFEQALKVQSRALELVNDGATAESYSTEQITGLRSRLELYRQERPYRMADIHQIPIRPPAQR